MLRFDNNNNDFYIFAVVLRKALWQEEDKQNESKTKRS